MVSEGNIRSAYVFGNLYQQERIEEFGNPNFVRRFMRERTEAARREQETSAAVEKSQLRIIVKVRRKIARKQNKYAAELFETFDSALVKWHVRNFVTRFPRFEAEDVAQECYAAVFLAALDYDSAKRTVSENFKAFATQRIAWRLAK